MSNMSAVDTPCLLAADGDAALDECPLKISVLMPALLRSSLIHQLIDALESGLCGFRKEIRSGEGSSGVDILSPLSFLRIRSEYLVDREICRENSRRKPPLEGLIFLFL